MFSRWGTGMGNSPPARKSAFWPLAATRLGSAKILARPFSLRMSKKAEIWVWPEWKPPMAFTLSDRSRVPSVWGAMRLPNMV